MKEHLAKSLENAKYIENIFRPNKEIEIGDTSLNIDEEHQAFTIPLNMCQDTDNPPILQFEDLLGYEICAGSQVV